MLQKDFDNKISTLLGLRENIDVVPPQEMPVTPFPPTPVLPTAPTEVNSNNDISEILKKQTELIEVIKAQNVLIQKLIETNQTPPPTQVVQQGGFVEKIINLKFDERGNPIGAEILAKPTVEDMLDLDELESQAHLALKIDLPTTEENN